MSQVVTVTLDCDAQRFPCGDHLKVGMSENMAEARTRARAKGWATGVRVTLPSGRKTVHDYCPLHKGSL